MQDYKILQLIPSPPNLKIKRVTSDKNSVLTEELEDIVCLALIENKSGSQEIRPVTEWGYGLEVMDKLTTVSKRMMVEEGEARLLITFTKQGE